MNREKDAIGALLDTYLGGGGDLFDPRPIAKDDRSGTSVSLTGVAADSASGALLVCEGEAILMAELQAWPAEVLGKTLAVTGIFGRTSAAPEPVVGADGGISHGAVGSSDSLSGATWQIVG